MRELRDYVLSEIKARIPEFRDVRVWNNQFQRSNNDDPELNDEDPFDYPCCFVEFEVENIRTVALGIQFVDVIIRLHLGIESYYLEHEEDFTFIDLVSDQMTGMRGNGTPVSFGSLTEFNVIFDGDKTNINKPIMEYKTTYTRVNNHTGKNNIDKTPPTDLNLNVNIDNG